jgi:hypothetical protein
MRNPDRWLPDDRDRPEGPDSRRSAVIGLLVIVGLLMGAFVLTQVLRGTSRLQDCALSGRSNCGISSQGRAP